jgi:hypothetical protein
MGNQKRSYKYMIATTSLARYGKHCTWQLLGNTMKWKEQSFSIQNHKRSLLLTFCCCDVHFIKVTYQKMAQNAEYSLDKLTDVILLFGEAEHNSAASAHLYTRRYSQ